MKSSEAHALLDTLDESVLRECVGRISVEAKVMLEHSNVVEVLPEGADKLEVVKRALAIGASVQVVIENLLRAFPNIKLPS